MVKNKRKINLFLIFIFLFFGYCYNNNVSNQNGFLIVSGSTPRDQRNVSEAHSRANPPEAGAPIAFG